MAGKATLSEQQKQVQDNIHYQLQNLESLWFVILINVWDVFEAYEFWLCQALGCVCCDWYIAFLWEHHSGEVTDENREAAQEAKGKAMEALSEGNFDEAIEHPTSAILYGNSGEY